MKSLNHAARLTAALLLTAAPVARAHPGHDLFSSGLPHALTSANHMIALALTGGALFALGFAVSQTRPRRWIQFTGVALVLGAACWRIAA
ncbi:MAG: hypothetical protein H7Y43_00710 [Akkermansiaceae bacterium]|nr:hypothetical protein [Verrucomicrobiales bacterium]